jgi:signal transduction histidine kinase
LNQKPTPPEYTQFPATGYSSESSEVNFRSNSANLSSQTLLNLLHSVEAIESENQLDKMLRQAVAQLLGLITADVAVVALIEPERSWVKLTAAGEAAQAFEGYRLRLAEGGARGLLEKALNEDRMIICDNCLAQGFSEVYQAHQLDRGVALPLRKQGKTFGVVGLFRQVSQVDALSPDDLTLLELFVRQVGPLLFNRRKLSELDIALKSRDEFLSIASHDLRNPLTALRGFSQLTARSIDKVPEGQPIPRVNIQANLQRIIKQTGSLDKLIGKLLDVSRINTDRLEIQPDDQQLDEIVAETVNHCRVAVATTENEDHIPPEQRHVIKLEIANKALWGNFDRERIAQVVTNLLDNAVKYSPEGGTIRVNLQRTNDIFATLTINDPGIGIPEEKQVVIFNRWSRINATREGEMSAIGLGLGLFICREIVRKHNGQIWLQSEPGEGSTFYVRLPLNAQ